jgi:predicted ATPase
MGAKHHGGTKPMKKNIIAFSGAHGTGKTTSVFELATALKKSGIDVGIVLEAARECPYPVMSIYKDKPSDHAQQWIFARQMMCEIEASEKYDVVVTDRTPVDCIGYTRYAGYHNLANSMGSYIQHHAPRYHCVLFKFAHDNPYCHEDGFRNTDMASRMKIEELIMDSYNYQRIKLDIWKPSMLETLIGTVKGTIAGCSGRPVS